jgi:hypothetical protein
LKRTVRAGVLICQGLFRRHLKHGKSKQTNKPTTAKHKEEGEEEKDRPC